MAETLRELVVRLSLESDNFTRNMRTINQQIKEAESTFRLAGAGVQNFDKTLQGAESKLSTLKSKLDMQKAAPLCFDHFNHAYHVIGEKVGEAWSMGASLLDQNIQ